MTSPTPSTTTISNTSCLIALEAIGRLDLLQSLYQNLLIPPGVAGEWGSALPSWIAVHPVQNQTLIQALRLQLGPGEAETIALAAETASSRLIIDDQRARRIATQLGMSITGTIGIILRAKQLGLVPLVRPLFDDLRANGFWLSNALLQQALQIAGE